MATIFISHVEEDRETAFALATILDSAGYTTWLYERDSVPGPSYLLQTGNAIEHSEAFVVILSTHSLGSHQVGREVVRAHESNKPFVPLLLGIDHAEYQRRQPEWREAIGAATALVVPKEGLASIRDRVIAGFTAILGASRSPASPPHEVSAGMRGHDGGPRQYRRAVRIGVFSVILTLVVIAAYWAFVIRPRSNPPGAGQVSGNMLPGATLPMASPGSATGASETTVPSTLAATRPLPTIAIFDFDDNTSDDSLHTWRKGMRDMLATDIAQGRRLQVVERVRLQDLLTEHQLSRDRFIDPTTAVRLGKGLAAHWIVVGSFLVFGNDVRVDARIVSVEQGTVVAAESVRGPKQGFLDLEKSLAEKLLVAVEANPEISVLQALRRPHTSNLDAFALYSQAMAAVDAGDREQARSLLEQAIALDSGFSLAAGALANLRPAGPN
jgi:TolB-like protein